MGQQNIINKYGQPGDETNLVSFRAPFPMFLSWDKSVSLSKIRCHKLIAYSLESTLKEILATYTLPEIKKLEIDSFGGCYNFRNMRGGSQYSLHSWGIAIDLNPEKNLLKWGKDKAQFAKPEYKDMINIFYKHGFESLGIEKNYDWMHFQIKV